MLTRGEAPTAVDGSAPAAVPAGRRRAWRPTLPGILLLAVLALGLVLRLWGVRHGLPAVYNLDEGGHFVKHAAGYFSGGYNPHYFQNPPGFSYLLHLVYAFWYGGIWPPGVGPQIDAAFQRDPSDLYAIGRVVAGLMGLVAAALVYVTGKRLYGAAVGLVAATLLTLTFLPVHYGHLALNDVPTLVPLIVSLFGAVLVYHRGDWKSYLLAGVALGVATAFKYTAAAAAVPITVAALLRVHADREALKPQLKLLVMAGAVSLLAFVVVNPFSVIEPREFGYYVRRQQQFSGGVAKVGLDDWTGWRYYL